MNQRGKRPVKTQLISDSIDEFVDGPKTAAKILARLSPSHQQRLINSIKKHSPELAIKITANILTYDDIASLTSQSIQLLIKETNHQDLVVSLKLAKEEVKNALYSNMTERKRKVVEDDLALLPPMRISEVEESQRKILVKLEELRTAGLVRSIPENEEYV